MYGWMPPTDEDPQEKPLHRDVRSADAPNRKRLGMPLYPIEGSKENLEKREKLKGGLQYFSCFDPQQLLCPNSRTKRRKGREVLSFAEVPVIDVPYKLVQNQEKKRQRRAAKFQQFMQRYGVDRQQSRLIVACKSSEYNHYKGQQYPPNGLILASQHWKNTKHIGDYFVINSYSKNPSIVGKRWSDARRSFADFGLAPELQLGLQARMAYKRPTVVQTLAFGPCMSGRNVLIAAETGSGKTMAYAAPVAHQILELKRRHGKSGGAAGTVGCHSTFARTDTPAEDEKYTPAGSSPLSESPLSPGALVLAPSLELARQIHGMIVYLTSHTDLNAICLTSSGDAVGNVDLVVGTPGLVRLSQINGGLKLDRLRHVVVDEADTLLDDSFSNAIVQLLADVKLQVRSPGKSRTSGAQLILASATFPQDLDTILSSVVDVDNLVHITTDSLHKLMGHVPQKFWLLKEVMKSEKLLSLVRRDVRDGQCVLVFAKNHRTVDYLYELLKSCGIDSGRLRGGMDIEERQRTFQRFQDRKLLALVATDVASRGLDTKQVSHVINYDFGRHLSDYIHRAGRVGRVGGAPGGHVTSFVRAAWEVDLVNIIEEAARTQMDLPDVDANIKKVIDQRAEQETPQ